MRYFIRAVPQREDIHGYLRERLPEAEWMLETDPEPSKRLHTANLIRAWRLQGRDPAVHLEDDVLLTRDFQSKVKRAVGPWWTDIVQMFSQRKADVEVGSRWEPGSKFLNMQCFYMPGNLAGPMADFYEHDLDWSQFPKGYPDDGGIPMFLQQHGLRYRVQVPSLVQHRDVGSTLGHKYAGAFGIGASPTFEDPWE